MLAYVRHQTTRFDRGTISLWQDRRRHLSEEHLKKMLEVIYIVRHGYRSNWIVDAATGTYSSNIRSPTGIPSDPALASYGVRQSEELAERLLSVSPLVDLIYSSPYYRCLQTLAPFVSRLDQRNHTIQMQVNVEPGLGEFYGLARFDHPSPASISVLNQHFPHLHADPETVIVPSTKGESITQLHDRVAYCLQEIIKRADADQRKPKSLLICTHAAVMIAAGRTLTGHMPENEDEEDFKCFTCSFSRFKRRGAPSQQAKRADAESWSFDRPEDVPDIRWRGGRGVAGGWDCEVNGDCSFLSGGEERGWRFSGDESFLRDPNAFNNNGSIVRSGAGEGVHGSGGLPRL